ncbi:MAG TPA: Hsp20/alpha crystallin family protein [Candidatus Acidoferrales bacterium]|nr:Hsp20/alpha crystallin family protein [Candidatus Acidoferrales bacterium]
MSEKGTAVQVAKQPTSITPIAPENLFERANSIFNAISRRAYELFEGNGRLFGRDLEDWFQAERELLHPVHINVTESGDAIEVKAEVPGFTEKELEINVEPRRLVISGKRETKKEEKKGKTLYSETCANQIMRMIDLPADVEAEKVTATLRNGVLDLNLPKSAKSRTVRVEPKAAA